MSTYKKKLLVIGSGHYSKVLGLYLLDDNSKYRIIAFVDDLSYGSTILNIPIIKSEDIQAIEYDCIVITSNIQETHKIMNKVIKQTPDIFHYIIENPIYNDTRVASLLILAEEVERKCLCEMCIRDRKMVPRHQTVYSYDLYQITVHFPAFKHFASPTSILPLKREKVLLSWTFSTS